MSPECRLAEAHEYQSIVDLVKTAGELYTAEGRPQDFITDLLKMDVPKPPAVEVGKDCPTDLTELLHGHIQRNALGSVLTEIIKKVELLFDGAYIRPFQFRAPQMKSRTTSKNTCWLSLKR